MRYSVLWNAVPISDEIVDVTDIVLLDTTYENAIVIPTASFTVINGDNEYTVGDEITLLADDGVIWRSIIDSIDTDIENGTKTLNCLDAIVKLRDYFAIDLSSTDYQAAQVIPEDYSGRNFRYSAGGSTTPHRTQFLTLTHLLKTALVKAGLVVPEFCNMNDMYGSTPSGFIYYTGSANADVYLEELAYHPQQIKYAKLTEPTEPLWVGATLLDLFLFTLQVLNAVWRYDKEFIVIERRTTGSSTPSNDHIYAASVRGYVNAFDTITAKATYLKTMNEGGFNKYVSGAINDSGYLTDESSSYPDVTSLTRKITTRTVELMRHAIVHRRKDLGSVYGMEELHYNAYNLPNAVEYYFTYQYARALYGRYPDADVVETLRTDDVLDTRTTRIPIKKTLNTLESAMLLEY